MEAPSQKSHRSSKTNLNLTKAYDVQGMNTRIQYIFKFLELINLELIKDTVITEPKGKAKEMIHQAWDAALSIDDALKSLSPSEHQLTTDNKHEKIGHEAHLLAIKKIKRMITKISSYEKSDIRNTISRPDNKNLLAGSLLKDKSAVTYILDILGAPKLKIAKEKLNSAKEHEAEAYTGLSRKLRKAKSAISGSHVQVLNKFVEALEANERRMAATHADYDAPNTDLQIPDIHTSQDAIKYITREIIPKAEAKTLGLAWASQRFTEVIIKLEKSMNKKVNHSTLAKDEVIKAEVDLIKKSFAPFHIKYLRRNQIHRDITMDRLQKTTKHLSDIIRSRQQDQTKLSHEVIKDSITLDKPKPITGSKTKTRKISIDPIQALTDLTPAQCDAHILLAELELKRAYKVADQEKSDLESERRSDDNAWVILDKDNPPVVNVQGKEVIFTMENILKEVELLENPTNPTGRYQRNKILKAMSTSLSSYYHVLLKSGTDPKALFLKAKVNFIKEVIAHLQRCHITDDELSILIVEVSRLCRVNELDQKQLTDMLKRFESKYKQTSLLGLTRRNPMINAAKTMVDRGCEFYKTIQPKAQDSSTWTKVIPTEFIKKAVIKGQPVDFTGAVAAPIAYCASHPPAHATPVKLQLDAPKRKALPPQLLPVEQSRSTGEAQTLTNEEPTPVETPESGCQEAALKAFDWPEVPKQQEATSTQAFRKLAVKGRAMVLGSAREPCPA